MRTVILIVASFYFISCGQNSQDTGIAPVPGEDMLIPKDEKAASSPGKEVPRVIARIDYRVMSCFGGGTYKLILVSSKGITSAILKTRFDSDTTVLNNYKMQAYNRFLSELKTKEFGEGCSTYANYSVQTSDEKFERTDQGCSWSGFLTLTNSLFRPKPDTRLKKLTVSP